VVRLAPAGGRTAPAPTTTASAPAGGGVPPTRGVDDAGAARSVRVDTPRYPNDPSITPDPVSLAGVARGWP
jgi:hypothetical protein